MNQSALKPINFWQPVLTLFVFLSIGFGLLVGVGFDANNALGHHGERHPSTYYIDKVRYSQYMGNAHATLTVKCPDCGSNRLYYRLHAVYEVYETTVFVTVYYSGREEHVPLNTVYLFTSVVDLGYGTLGRCPTCEQNKKLSPG